MVKCYAKGHLLRGEMSSLTLQKAISCEANDDSFIPVRGEGIVNLKKNS